jgi:hypothetical protein
MSDGSGATEEGSGVSDIFEELGELSGRTEDGRGMKRRDHKYGSGAKVDSACSSPFHRNLGVVVSGEGTEGRVPERQNKVARRFIDLCQKPFAAGLDVLSVRRLPHGRPTAEGVSDEDLGLVDSSTGKRFTEELSRLPNERNPFLQLV